MVIGAIGSNTGAGAVNLSQLAELYRQQVTAGVGDDSAASAVTAPGRAAATRGTDFAQAIGNGLQQVESLDQTASAKAVQAATGDLTDVHDYVIAATQAQVATELTTTLRNKALDAFNEIMRMPL
jgi:flagellar hook-basal body complex protein FliE